MDLTSLFYVAEVFENLRAAAGGFTFAGVVVIVITLAITGASLNFTEYPYSTENATKYRRLRNYVLGGCALMICGSTFVQIFVPSKNTMYMMAGVKVAEQIVTSPEVKQINSKIIKVINQKLDSVIEEKK
ncbi:hypothetical protein D3C87_125380 [compost metagenome]